jgi:hypothetical protein
MRISLFIMLCCMGSAHAQFNLDRLNINKLLDTTKNVVKATSDIGEPEEIQIGKDLAARLLGAAPLAKDENLQRYVNRVGRWLALQTERPDLPWQFGVMEAPQLNAFAVPGGTIFVTRGLVERMKSEAELAGVLAHEISHVLRKHHLKAIQKGAQTALAGDALNQALRNQRADVRDKLVSFGSEMYTRGLDKGDEPSRPPRRGDRGARRLRRLRLAGGAADAAGDERAGFGAGADVQTHPAPGGVSRPSVGRCETLDAYASQPQLADRFLQQVKVRR